MCCFIECHCCEFLLTSLFISWINCNIRIMYKSYKEQVLKQSFLKWICSIASLPTKKEIFLFVYYKGVSTLLITMV